MKGRCATLAALAAVGLGVVTASEARAADASQASAQALFDEARALLARGEVQRACPKFAESQRLAPAPGTLLNLGNCLEKLGRTASAWAAFKDAITAARTLGQQDREKYAISKAQALEGRLSRARVVVPGPSDLPDLEVRLDGVALGRAAWGTQVPVDPGNHEVTATAAERRPWSARFTVAAERGSASVTIPRLEPGPARAREVASTPVEAPRGAQREIGYVVGGAGIVLLGAGAYFGLRAKDKNDEALRHCDGGVSCDPLGLSLTDEAKDAATMSTVAFAVGGAALAAGLVLVLTAPRGRPATAVRVGLGRIAIGGAF